MKKILFVMTQPPFSGSEAREGQDMALFAASFDQEVSMVFLDDAVYALVADQTPEKLGKKDFLARYKALDIFDIESVYVCALSLKDRNLKIEDLTTQDAQLIEESLLEKLIKSHDHVMVF